MEEVRPKILATGTSNMNMYHSVYEGELTDPNVGMTHYKGKNNQPPLHVYRVGTNISFFHHAQKIALNF